MIPVGLRANTAVSTATGGAGTGGTTTNQGDDTENVTDSETPLSPGDGTEEVPDDQTPLKKGEEGINYNLFVYYRWNCFTVNCCWYLYS